MNLFTIQAIQVVLYFIMPGVIAVTVHDSMVASERRNWQEMSLALVTYGVINLFIFTLLSPIIQFIPVFQLSLLIVPQKLNGTALVFLDVVIPVVMAWLSVRVQRSESVHRFFRGIFMSPDPGPWDYVFSNRYKIYCLIFHLKDGRKLAGLYEKGAYASGFPNKEVYVKELCSIDPKSLVVKKLPGSSGAIISLDECFFIEFYERPAQHSPLIQRSTLWQKISSLTKMVRSIKVFSRRNHQPSSGRGGIAPLPPPPQTLSLSNTTIPSPQSLTPPEQGPQQLPSQPQQSIQDKPLGGNAI
jgi:hypothetical protein